MVSFRENIVWLRDDGNNTFPERFNCEIYYTSQIRPIKENIEYTSNFSIKHVFRGEERYLLNGKRKIVGNSQTMIVNDQSDIMNVHASGNAFSIFISPFVLNQCFYGLTTSDNDQLDNPISYRDFELNFYDDAITQQSDLLNHLKFRLESNPNLLVTTDYYYELAESLILWQNAINRKINKIDRKRLASRQEIYSRLNLAHTYLMDNLTQGFNLNDISLEAGISKFQLIRNFKSVFGMTPHRYFITERMQLAKKLILNSPGKSISEIAHSIGFPDIFSFSKQFKQIFGINPSTFKSLRN